MAIDLGIVGAFIAAQVAPEKEASHQQYNPADNQRKAKPRIAGGLLPAEISLRSRQGRMFTSFNLWSFGHGRSCAGFHITCSSDIAARPVPRIPWRGPVRSWPNCGRTSWRYSFRGPTPPSAAPG